MKILVTGGAGFIGSHIVDAYVAAGHDVVALDDLSTGKEANLNPGARFYKADICVREIAEIFEAERFEVVNHQAAQVDVRHSVADPAADARVNILGSLTLMEHAVRHRVRAFLFASSGGAIYGEPPKLPATEAGRPMPLSPYGVAKLAVEQYLHAYAHLHRLRSISLRYGNVYGPRQDPFGEAGVVAIFSERLLQRKPPIVYGDGSQTRDYIYVADVARANLLALEYLSSTRASGGSPQDAPRACVCNIGTGVETSVLELVRALGSIVPASDGVPPEFAPPRPGEVSRIALDSTRARELLGWEPLVPLAEGLRLTTEWLRVKYRASGGAGGGLQQARRSLDVHGRPAPDALPDRS